MDNRKKVSLISTTINSRQAKTFQLPKPLKKFIISNISNNFRTIDFEVRMEGYKNSPISRIRHYAPRTRPPLQTMAHCSVPQCTNDWRFRERYTAATKKKLSFHEFPKNKHLRKRWITLIRRDEGPNFEVSDIAK